MPARTKKPKPTKPKPGDAPPLRLEWMLSDELRDNDFNWRLHPDAQTSALREVLAEVGWAGALLYNERTQRLIDGHARKKVAPGQKVPVLVGSWTEEQEKKILATLDPIASMAGADREKLDALLREVQTGSEAVTQMLADLAPPDLIDFSAAPPTVQQNIEDMEEVKRQRREGDAGIREKADTERYLMVVFASREEKQALLERLGLPSDERYVAAAGLEIRAKGIPRRVESVSGRNVGAADQGNAGATG